LEEGCKVMLETHQNDYKNLEEFLINRQQASNIENNAPQSFSPSIHFRFLRDPSEFKIFSLNNLTTTIKELLDYE
jgi:hypothetical protein